jgi:KTSC domain
MAADPTQRVGNNAFHLPVFLIQNLSREDPDVTTLHLFSTEQYSFCKTDRVQRRLLIFIISTAPVVAAWAEPSPTPNHITSRIPRQSVQSSAIAKVGYSKRHHILEIEFVNGAVYRYFDIPLSVHRDLMSAESKARFYDSKIRKHYRSVLVRPRQKEQH